MRELPVSFLCVCLWCESARAELGQALSQMYQISCSRGGWLRHGTKPKVEEGVVMEMQLGMMGN